MEYYLKRLSLYVLGTVVTDWWDNDDSQIAFCRGEEGLIAFNDQHNTDLVLNLQVNLPTKSALES
jgi:hypothetical protein